MNEAEGVVRPVCTDNMMLPQARAQNQRLACISKLKAEFPLETQY